MDGEDSLWLGDSDMSFRIEREESDDDEEQARRDIQERLQNDEEMHEQMKEILDDYQSDDEDDDNAHLYNHEQDLSTGEINQSAFHRNINDEKTVFTSTPYTSVRPRPPVSVGLLPPTHLVMDSPQRDRRGGGGDPRGGDFHRQLRNRDKLEAVLESESTEMTSTTALQRSGEEQRQQQQQRSGPADRDWLRPTVTASTSLSPSVGRLNNRLVERNNAFGGGSSGKVPISGRGDSGQFGSPTADADDLLRQDSLDPTPIKAHQAMLSEAKDRQISELRAGMNDKCDALEGEIRSLKEHLHDLSLLGDDVEENHELGEARQQDSAEISRLNQLVLELQTSLKSCRVDLNYANEEKAELLRKLHINEGTTKQIKQQLAESTTWDTIDILKTQNEKDRADLKEAHESQMRREQEQNRKEMRQLEEQLDRMRQETQQAKEKLQSSEQVKVQLTDELAKMRKEIDLNAASYSDRRREQQTNQLLQNQLKTKTNEAVRLAERVTDLEARAATHHATCSVEVGQLREELATLLRQNSELVAEQANAKQETLTVSEEALRLTAGNTALQIARTKLEAELARLKLTAEKNATENEQLKATMESWKKDLDVLRRDREELRKQLENFKDSRNLQSELQATVDQYHALEREWKKLDSVVEAHNEQLKRAAEDNDRLNDENKALQSEVHQMKKVLRKLKQFITSNPSPSSDSGICTTDNKNDAARVITSTRSASGDAATVLRDEDLGNRAYVRELIAKKADVRLELQREYQQQLDVDRQAILDQLDAVYVFKLTKFLATLGIDVTTVSGLDPTITGLPVRSG
ncbi:hypothetical protein BV898_11529 [Hypsibius exemplaris]|uniref:Uncharacterized protein n=1 Tax=Hypsibius exemplaris TaxID=2072580 RepID=A0A1W0WGG5_HYPEX|nr:hypothetical protein BV898_11529 [Hypsibius exemplaris]